MDGEQTNGWIKISHLFFFSPLFNQSTHLLVEYFVIGSAILVSPAVLEVLTYIVITHLFYGH